MQVSTSGLNRHLISSVHLLKPSTQTSHEPVSLMSLSDREIAYKVWTPSHASREVLSPEGGPHLVTLKLSLLVLHILLAIHTLSNQFILLCLVQLITFQNWTDSDLWRLAAKSESVHPGPSGWWNSFLTGISTGSWLCCSMKSVLALNLTSGTWCSQWCNILTLVPLWHSFLVSLRCHHMSCDFLLLWCYFLFGIILLNSYTRTDQPFTQFVGFLIVLRLLVLCLNLFSSLLCCFLLESELYSFGVIGKETCSVQRNTEFCCWNPFVLNHPAHWLAPAASIPAVSDPLQARRQKCERRWCLSQSGLRLSLRSSTSTLDTIDRRKHSCCDTNKLIDP